MVTFSLLLSVDKPAPGSIRKKIRQTFSPDTCPINIKLPSRFMQQRIQPPATGSMQQYIPQAYLVSGQTVQQPVRKNISGGLIRHSIINLCCNRGKSFRLLCIIPVGKTKSVIHNKPPSHTVCRTVLHSSAFPVCSPFSSACTAGFIASIFCVVNPRQVLQKFV